MPTSPSPSFPDTSQLPRLQAIALSKAAKDCRWASKTVQEWQGVQGQEPSRVHDVTMMFGADRPEFATKMAELEAKFGTIVSADHYIEVLNEITSLTEWFTKNPVISDKRISVEEHNRRQEQIRQNQEASRKADALAAEKQQQLAAITPVGAGAYVLAELHEEESDHQSDYFAHRTKRQVLIGFRTGGREDFRLLRRAAALFPETRHLGPACAIFFAVAKDTEGSSLYLGEDGRPSMFSGRREFSTQAEAEQWLAAVVLNPERFPHGATVQSENIEHRENYSMGSGNYLKAGHSNSSGWCVKSRQVGALSGAELASLEFAPHLLQKEVAAPKSRSQPASKAPISGAAEVRFNEEKGGVEIHFAAKPDASRLDHLRSSPFRWSRFSNCWWAKRTAETEKLAYDLAGIPAPVAPHAARNEPAGAPSKPPAAAEPFHGTIQRIKTLAQFLEENPKVHYQVTPEGSHVITLNGVPAHELYDLVDFRVSTVAGPVIYVMPFEPELRAPNSQELGALFDRVEGNLANVRSPAISHG